MPNVDFVNEFVVVGSKESLFFIFVCRSLASEKEIKTLNTISKQYIYKPVALEICFKKYFFCNI